MSVCNNIGYRVYEEIKMYNTLDNEVGKLADSILAGGILLKKDYQFLQFITGIECKEKNGVYNLYHRKDRLGSYLIRPEELYKIPDRSLILYEHSIDPWDKMYKTNVTRWSYPLNSEFRTFIGVLNEGKTVTGSIITPMGESEDIYLPKNGDADIEEYDVSECENVQLRELMDNNPTISSCLIRDGEGDWWTYARGEDTEVILRRMMKKEYGISI